MSSVDALIARESLRRHRASSGGAGGVDAVLMSLRGRDPSPGHEEAFARHEVERQAARTRQAILQPRHAAVRQPAPAPGHYSPAPQADGRHYYYHPPAPAALASPPPRQASAPPLSAAPAPVWYYSQHEALHGPPHALEPSTPPHPEAPLSRPRTEFVSRPLRVPRPSLVDVVDNAGYTVDDLAELAGSRGLRDAEERKRGRRRETEMYTAMMRAKSELAGSQKEASALRQENAILAEEVARLRGELEEARLERAARVARLEREARAEAGARASSPAAPAEAASPASPASPGLAQHHTFRSALAADPREAPVAGGAKKAAPAGAAVADAGAATPPGSPGGSRGLVKADEPMPGQAGLAQPLAGRAHASSGPRRYLRVDVQ